MKRALRLIFSVVLLVLSFMVVVSDAVAAAEVETKEFDVKGLRLIDVRNLNGSVKIHSGGPQTPIAKVIATKNEFSPTCRLIMERNDQKLVVHVKQGGFINSDDCKVDLDLLVPRKVTVEISLGSGDVELRDLEGDLKFKIGTGRLTGVGHFTSVAGEGGSGDVSLNGMAGGGFLKSGTANYDLTFARSPLKGDLEISVATGNANLRFAKGTMVQTKLTAASGKVTNELGESPAATFKIHMKAASGGLAVKGY